MGRNIEKVKKGFEYAKEIVKDPEVTIPLAVSAVSWPIMFVYGCPRHLDKGIHIALGYGLSKLGRKAAKLTGNEEYETIASAAVTLIGGLGWEALETSPHGSKITNYIFNQNKKPTTVDDHDIFANIGGCVIENVRNKYWPKFKGYLKRKKNE